MSNLEKFLPRKLQSPKEALRIVLNVSAGIFLVLMLGLDLSKLGISPTVNLWTSGIIAIVSGLALTWISNHQHETNGGA